MNRQLTQNAHSEWFLQPNCYCIVFCEKTLTMKAISENFQQILDADAALYLNKVLKSIFQENEIEAFLRATKNLKEGEMHLLNLATSNTWGGYNIYISTIAEHYLLEFEKKSTQAAKENQLRNTLAQIEQLKNEPQCIHDLLANIGRNVNADRTLYLRFDLKGNADTVDEYTKEGTLPYFKGLKIPKNDFPWYLKLLLSTQRLHFTQHCLLNPVKILTVSTFNFSFEKTASQSLSKYHLNYLKSLGLKSCIYLPIYFDNNLWGSLVFFFNKEKILPSSERNYLEIISSFLGHKVNILVEKQKAINRNGRSRIENAILKKIVEENYFLDAFKETENELLKIANAIGMVVIYEDDIHFFGNTPSKDKINRLQSWVFEKAPKDIYYTESLASDFSAFLPIKKDFCGLLAVPLSNLKPYYTNLKPYYIFWFRPEVNKVLKWSGNPNRNAQNDDEELPTFVYESSSNWKMVFAGKSKPWKKSTINAILNIQNITLKSLKNRRDIIYKQLAKEQIIYKNSPELLLIFKEDFSIKYVSYSVKEILGFSPETFIKKWPEIIRFKHRAAFSEYFQSFLKNSSSNNKFIYQLENINGEFQFFESTLSNSLLHPQINGVVANTRNVDSYLKIAKRLKKYEKILEISTNGILIISTQNTMFPVVFVNPAFKEITGFNSNEILNQPFPFLEYDGINNQAIHSLHKAFKESKSCEVLLQCKKKDGTEYWNYTQIAPVADIYRQETSFIAVITDVTYRRETEEKLDAYMSKLRKSNEELQTFAYVASHDLQEPLRTITGFTELIAETHKGQLGEETDEYIEFILQATHRMRKLIQDLLLFSRVSTEKEYITEVDLNDTVTTALENLQSAVEETQALIIYDALPKVFANQTMILQVFQNIISNALKYRKSDKLPKIHISLEDDTHSWMFCVEDNGIGIDSQYFERIFIIFQRLHTKEEYSGTGIGLAICKKIIERYGGKIWLESEPNVGSKFYFTIPKELNLE